MLTVFISEAALFRLIDKYHPTILMDEMDNQFKDYPYLTHLVNAGCDREDAFVPRCEGDTNEVKLYPVFCPKAVAQIGKVYNPAMADRAITIRMVRRTKTEPIARRIPPVQEFEPLHRKLLHWAKDNGPHVKAAQPAFPEALNDRAIDKWEPLLAIAKVAGKKAPRTGNRRRHQS